MVSQLKLKCCKRNVVWWNMLLSKCGRESETRFFMLKRANAKESEGSGPCMSSKEGRIGDLNVWTSKANPG